MPADTFVILLVWFFAALECVAWDTKDVVYFRTLTWKRWRLVRPSRLLENTVAGLAFLFPLPPLGAQARAHYPRMAFSPEGLSAYVPESGDAPPVRGKDHYLYDEISEVATRADEILINGQPFVRVHSKGEAARLAEIIRKARGKRGKARERIVEDHVAGLFDRPRISAAVKDLEAGTDWLLMFCNFLWVSLIVGMPVFIDIYGFSRPVVPVLALVIALHLLVTGMTLWAHKAVYGRPDYSILYMLLPSPFHSVRAVDHLAKKLLASYHPFAVAGALLDRDRFVSYARQRLALIRHPLNETSRSAKSREIDAWYKTRIVRAMEEAVRELGIDLDSLGRPDAAGLDASYQSYCPRCHGVYQVPGGVCGDCPETALVPLRNGSNTAAE